MNREFLFQRGKSTPLSRAGERIFKIRYVCMYIYIYMHVCVLCVCVLEGFVINLLKTKRRLLYVKTQFVPRSKHFSSRL